MSLTSVETAIQTVILTARQIPTVTMTTIAILTLT
jgi:hypothetical protein